MKVLALCALLAAAFVLLHASPVEQERRSVAETVKSFLMKVDFISPRDTQNELFIRQTTCTNNSDCYPPQITSVPQSLISCVGGVCDCNDCFERGDNVTCVQSSCDEYSYDEAELECKDDRPKQLTALLLSVFISSTGAANFYIGRDDLAAGQLVIFLVMLVACYSICYIPCCLGCCMAKEDMKGSVFFICLMLLVLVVVILCLLANWAWWLADLIIFATNQRDAGNGCELSPI